MDIKRAPPNKRRKGIIYGALAVLLLGAATATVARIEPSVPSVDRATLLIDTVRQGDLVRQVRGPGTLVAEGHPLDLGDHAGPGRGQAGAAGHPGAARHGPAHPRQPRALRRVEETMLGAF